MYLAMTRNVIFIGDSFISKKLFTLHPHSVLLVQNCTRALSGLQGMLLTVGSKSGFHHVLIACEMCITYPNAILRTYAVIILSVISIYTSKRVK